MSILESKRYEVKDVLTSFNYGKPLNAVSRRVVVGLEVLLGILCVVMTVSMLYLALSGQWQPEMWTMAAALAVDAAVIAVMSWALKRADKTEKLIEDCLNDAVETNVIITNEIYFYQDGSNSFTHVARFRVAGEDYAITYSKTSVQPKDRKDIVYLLGEPCRALYSRKHNDLLILEVIRSGEDGEIL